MLVKFKNRKQSNSLKYIFHKFYHQKAMPGSSGDQAHRVETRAHMVSPHRALAASTEIIALTSEHEKDVVVKS